MDKESKFYLRLKLLSSSLGKSINQIEKELGYSRNALHNYNESHIPSATRLIELSDYFKVSPNYLIGKSDVPNLEVFNLDELFDKLTISEKMELFSICSTWILNNKEDRELKH
jgi:transcriptional regulator with XRE-family HTH domain